MGNVLFFLCIYCFKKECKICKEFFIHFLLVEQNNSEFPININRDVNCQTFEKEKFHKSKQPKINYLSESHCIYFLIRIKFSVRFLSFHLKDFVGFVQFIKKSLHFLFISKGFFLN